MKNKIFAKFQYMLWQAPYWSAKLYHCIVFYCSTVIIWKNIKSSKKYASLTPIIFTWYFNFTDKLATWFLWLVGWRVSCKRWVPKWGYSIRVLFCLLKKIVLSWVFKFCFSQKSIIRRKANRTKNHLNLDLEQHSY